MRFKIKNSLYDDTVKVGVKELRKVRHRGFRTNNLGRFGLHWHRRNPENKISPWKDYICIQKIIPEKPLELDKYLHRKCNKQLKLRQARLHLGLQMGTCSSVENSMCRGQLRMTVKQD